MDSVSDLCRVETSPALTLGPRSRLEPHHPLREVPIRAAGEERDRAVGQPADPMARRLRDQWKLSQPWCKRRQRLADSLEERQLTRLARVRLDDRGRRDRGRRAVARDVDDRLATIDAEHDGRGASLDLDRCRRRIGDGLGEPEPFEHPGDRRLLTAGPGRVDRARHDQPLHRARHRDVVQAKALFALGLLAALLHVLVRRGVDAGTRLPDARP